MSNHKAGRRAANKRLVVALAFSLIAIVSSACHLVHKPVETEKLLTPLLEADTAQLIATVNNLVAVRSIHGTVDIQFEDTSFATAGIAEKYRAAEGSITLQRPGNVYLVVQGPFATPIAHMASDGEHFRIAILKGDDRYRRFVRGTNDAVYPKLDLDGKIETGKKDKTNPEAQTVNALSNLRPQHFTEALLIGALDPHAAGVVYAQSEFFESEKDTSQPNSRKRVVRGYYFLDEFRTIGDNSARLRRRFWFHRVGNIRLARLQTFDEKGLLTTDVSYGPLQKFGAEGNLLLPAQVSLTRPQDHYKITITYQTPETITVNHDYPPEAFVFENKWGLREVDLDAEKRSATPRN